MPPKIREEFRPHLAQLENRSPYDLSQLAETGVFLPPGPVVSEKGDQANLGELIRSLRKDKGISQEELARKAQMDRTTIARVECGVIRSLSMEKLEGIAQAIGTDLKTLLFKVRPAGESSTYRGHMNQIAFSLDYPEDGFRIVSLIPKRREFFFGRIEIRPQKTVVSSKLPRVEQIYLHLFEGKLLLTRLAKEMLLKTGDCFIFSGTSDYEFYNPELLKSVSALFVTYPSFLPV